MGIDWDGRHQILRVEMVDRDSQPAWRTFHLGWGERGLTGMEFVAADDRTDLRAAIREDLSEVADQQRYVRSFRNVVHPWRCRADDDCLQQLRWPYDRRAVEEVRQDLESWPVKWEARYPRLVA